MRPFSKTGEISNHHNVVNMSKFDLIILVLFSVLYNLQNIRILITNRFSEVFTFIDNFYLNTINSISREGLSFPLGNYEKVPNIGSIPVNPFPLGERLLAFVKLISGMGITQVYVLSTLVLTLLMSLLFYKVVSLFIVNRTLILFAVVASISFVFAGNYTLLRPINPSFNFLVWCFFVHSVLNYQRYINHKFLKNLPHLTLACCLLLSSPFYISHAILLYLYFLFTYAVNSPKVTRIEYFTTRLPPVLLVSAVLIAVTSWRLHNWSQRPWRDYGARLGLVDSHLPSAKEVILLSLLGSFLVLWKKSRSQDLIYRRFLIYLNMIVLLLSNSNVVTGKYLQFSDHFNQISRFTFALSLIFFLFKWNLNAKSQVLLMLCSLIFCTFSYAQQGFLHRTTIGVIQSNSSLGAISKTLSNLPKNSTVSSDLDLHTLDLLSIHRDINFIFSGNTALYPISNQEVASRFFLYNKCEPISRDLLLTYEPYIFVYAYSASYLKQANFRDLLNELGFDVLQGVEKNRSILDEFATYIEDLDTSDCGRLIEDFGVNYVLTNNLDVWNPIIQKYIEEIDVIEGGDANYWLIKIKAKSL